MKKLIISGVFCSVLMLGGFQVASAEETTTTAAPATSNAAMLAKIQDLMKLIADLKAKLAVAQGEVQELVADLEEGAQGDDIKKVQEVLATDPTLFGAKPTGYFGPMTREALKKFQDRYGLEVTGKLDEGTREAIKELRKDGQVAPGLLKSEAVKDRIKSRLQDKWQNCDFTRPFRASLCEKVKEHQDKGKGKDMDDEDGEDMDDEDDTTPATRDEALAAIKEASDAVAAFKKEVDEMEEDEVEDDILEEAEDNLADAQKKLSDARRALVKREFGDAVEKAESALEKINGDDDSDDEDEDEDEDEDDEDDEDEDDD